LKKIVNALVTVPDNFSIHPKLIRRFKEIKMLFGEGKADWAMAESFAFGSLLLEGRGVRLSSEDSQRGTFAHRHSVYRDIATEEPYIPLNSLSENKGNFVSTTQCFRSIQFLALTTVTALSIPICSFVGGAVWGFANGGEVIIDQFITSSLKSGEVHQGLSFFYHTALKGRGQNISNAYPERYLQMASEENIEIINLTKSSQYFHLLRRAILRDFRKPIFVMAPKSTLRHPLMNSDLKDFESGSFNEFIGECDEIKSVRRVIFCSGKIFFDLYEKRRRENIKNVAIVRIEQIYPFNEEKFLKIAGKYQDVNEIAWVQEETENRGAYNLHKRINFLIFLTEKLNISAERVRQPHPVEVTNFLKRSRKRFWKMRLR